MAKNKYEKNIFGLALEFTLKKKKLEQKQFAEMVDTDQGNISGYITGRTSPTFRKMCKIADALECNIVEFLRIGENLKAGKRSVGRDSIGVPKLTMKDFEDAYLRAINRAIEAGAEMPDADWREVFRDSMVDVIENCFENRIAEIREMYNAIIAGKEKIITGQKYRVIVQRAGLTILGRDLVMLKEEVKPEIQKIAAAVAEKVAKSKLC